MKELRCTLVSDGSSFIPILTWLLQQHQVRYPIPKKTLHKLLRQASGLTGRRLQKFPVASGVQRMASLIDDFSPLRALPAFAALEGEIGMVVREQGWGS